MDKWTPEKRQGERRAGIRLTDAQRRLKQDAFLEAFARTGIVLTACQQAEVSRSIVYYWQEHDADFGYRYAQTKPEADDRIRAEIFRRAVTGIKKPIYYQGQKVGELDEYSDNLLMFMAKARMEEFRTGEPVRVVFDEDSFAWIADILQRNITDPETLARVQGELLRQSQEA